MGARGTSDRLPVVRTGVHPAVARGAAVLLLALGGLFGLGLTPALAAAPVPGPGTPYGGALESPEPGTTWNDEQMLEVGMLALGSVNGLAFVGVVILSRFRGPSAEETRHALINRTAPGVPCGEGRRSSRRRAAARRNPSGPPSRPVPPIPHQGGPAVPAPRPGAAPAPVPAVRPATTRR